MGVYINGMEMPTKENAVILITPSGDVWMIGDMPNEDTHLVKAKAVTVLPHGDLVDKQRMVDEVRKHEKAAYDEVVALHKQKRFDETYEYYRGYSDGLITASGLVRFAPAIIPASEEDE